jgi:hypothetical protein
MNCRQPVQAGEADAQGVGAIDLGSVKVAPDFLQVVHPLAEVLGEAGQRGGVDGAGRGAADDGKRVVPRLRQQFADGAQHPDLVGGAGAAPGENQRRPGETNFHAFHNGRPAPALKPVIALINPARPSPPPSGR